MMLLLVTIRCSLPAFIHKGPFLVMLLLVTIRCSLPASIYKGSHYQFFIRLSNSLPSNRTFVRLILEVNKLTLIITCSKGHQIGVNAYKEEDGTHIELL